MLWVYSRGLQGNPSPKKGNKGLLRVLGIVTKQDCKGTLKPGNPETLLIWVLRVFWFQRLLASWGLPRKGPLGFRVSGLGFRVQGLGFRVSGSGLREARNLAIVTQTT